GERRFYGFLGAGAAYYQQGGNGLKIGLRGGLGVDLNESWLLEASSFLAQRSPGGITGNVIGFYVGYKFK
ncbi:hypothetical protein, partial [Enterococcus faecium]